MTSEDELSLVTLTERIEQLSMQVLATSTQWLVLFNALEKKGLISFKDVEEAGQELAANLPTLSPDGPEGTA